MSWKSGDSVWVVPLKTNGVVTDVKRNGSFRVTAGSITLTCTAEMLLAPKLDKPNSAKDERKSRGYSVDSETNLSVKELLTLDLHGCNVVESIRRTEEHLSRCVVAGVHEVEIVHGIGSGALKRALHEFLKTCSIVQNFKEREFNPGATRVFLMLALMLSLWMGAVSLARADDTEASPHEGWQDVDIEHEKGPSIGRQILLWVPNRFLDFIDIFKLDVGVGPAFGAVVRVTKWGPVGYRQMLPLSARVGAFGRALPVKIEHGAEIGIGPAYWASPSRKVCPGEVGAGAELLVAGAYGGICVDEMADFVLGIFFIDFKDDDLK